MASSFGPEGPDLIPDAAEDPPSVFGVHARKIRGSKSSIVGRQHFTMGVVYGENFPPFQRHIKIVKVEGDGVAIYRKEVEIGLPLP